MGSHSKRRTCPFCGWHYSDMKKRAARPGYKYFVKCCSAHCNARGPEADTREEASKLWDKTIERLNRHGLKDDSVPITLVPEVLYEI